MTEERKNELDKMMEAGDFDALKDIKDPDEQRYIMQQVISEMNGGKIKDEETRINIIKDCVAHLGSIEDMDELKTWLDIYTVKDERFYAEYVFKILYIFRTSNVKEMIKYLDDIKQLPYDLLPKDILRRITQLDKIKDMNTEEVYDFTMEGVNMIGTFIDNIMTVYNEHEIMFDIANIALDLHVYSKDGTFIHKRVTTKEIEEAYVKNNK